MALSFLDAHASVDVECHEKDSDRYAMPPTVKTRINGDRGFKLGLGEHILGVLPVRAKRSAMPTFLSPSRRYWFPDPDQQRHAGLNSGGSAAPLAHQPRQP